ncbi:hypothetical protein PBRA_009205 [Plasmodiophora brassicae]|uniref:Disease resistance R13L4/SHOC-2-like LRR domain-containing protein n=1 Tax=Plasmodiophora brassicae TaxID=37360 RepID=A0A0G4J639_PLABS|nr:hypothetical protein PBRA_009205 [Plasmodiophora brassicae]
MKRFEVIAAVTAAAAVLIIGASGQTRIVRQAGSRPAQQYDAQPQPPMPIANEEQNGHRAGQDRTHRVSGTTYSGDAIRQQIGLPDDIIRKIFLEYGTEDVLRTTRLASKPRNEDAVNEMAVRIHDLRPSALSKFAVIAADKFLADNGSFERLATLDCMTVLCRKFVQFRFRTGASHPRCRAVVNDIFCSTDTPGWLDMMPFLVQCGADTSLVTDLSLDNNQLQSIPAEIGQLTSLECLALDNNQLQSIPAEIGQLTSLKTLNLENNQLRAIPAELSQLTSLKYLCEVE